MKVVDEPSAYVSHFQNVNAHSKMLRYGIPVYIIGVLSLLLASDIGSGISAALYFSSGGKVLRVEQLLSLSIFTSVRELWRIGSYPVAILIAVLSIAWPYCKLILTMFVWVMPWNSKNSRRRELIVEILDACSKWSLVDVLVLLILMVGLRYTADLSTLKLNVFINPEWGLSGFIAASIMSLVSSHLVLYLHRKVIYEKDMESDIEENDGDTQNKPMTVLEKSGNKAFIGLIASVPSLIIFCLGYFLDIVEFEYENLLGSSRVSFSLCTIGTHIPLATNESNSPAIRWLQVIYFIITIVAPLLNHIMHLCLYLVPMKVTAQRQVLLMSEIVSAWNAIDVLAIGLLFSIWQIPKIANKIIDVGCTQCYTIESRLKATSSLAFIGAFMYISCCYYLNIQAHRILYGKKK